jgi:hypothetical protein
MMTNETTWKLVEVSELQRWLQWEVNVYNNKMKFKKSNHICFNKTSNEVTEKKNYRALIFSTLTNFHYNSDNKYLKHARISSNNISLSIFA